MRNDLKAAVDRLAENLRDAEETINDRTVHSMVRDEARKNIPAFSTALDALRDALKRQPDPITGLVPCGCGGKALCSDQRLCTFDGEWLWRVECTECRVSTDGYSDADEAKAKWNRAMV